MNKFIILTMLLLGSVHGMDGPTIQELQNQRINAYIQRVQALARESGARFQGMEYYTCYQWPQKQLNEAESPKDVIAIGEGFSEITRSAPFEVGLNSFSITDKEMVKIIQLIPNLTALTLHNMEIPYGQLAYLGDLKNLVKLTLKGTGITDMDVECVSDMPSLIELELVCMHIRDQAMESLSRLPNLKTLIVYSDLMTDKGLVHLSRLNNLTNLNVTSPKITDKGIEHLSYMLNLRSLEIFTAVTDKGLVHLSRLVDLTTLSLSFELSPEPSLEFLNKLSNLTTLHLGAISNSVEGMEVNVEPMSSLPNLESLSFDQMPLSDKGWEHLSNIPKLRQLIFIRLEDFTCKGLAHLSNMSNLRVLMLDKLELSDTGAGMLSGIPHLETLSVGSHHITDTGIKHFSSFSTLKSLQFDGDQLSKVGRNSLMGLTNLENLWLTSQYPQTPESKKGLKALKKVLPNCKVKEVYSPYY